MLVKKLDSAQEIRELLFWEVESALKRFELDFQTSTESIQVLRHAYVSEIIDLAFSKLEVR
ncbi:hypothetical protein EHQ12_05780 [Leptospira gomenensis]|nr:hypothetical protein EHQ12_05780 [Leptospira gomenensis]